MGYAGEISISQSRIELQVGTFRQNLEEMQQTVSRLREQLRQLELETESQIIYRHERENTSDGEDDFDPLELDRFTRMQELSRGLAESVGDLGNIRDMLTELTRESEGILVQQARTNTELQHGLMQTRMLPIERLVPRFRRIVRQTARELEKQIRVEITGEDIRIDRAILNRMVGPLEHIFRNAVDHGVEAPSLRAERGKEEVALLQMDVSRDGPEVVIRIADDGNGIDLEAVQSCVAARVVTAGRAGAGRRAGADHFRARLFDQQRGDSDFRPRRWPGRRAKRGEAAGRQRARRDAAARGGHVYHSPAADTGYQPGVDGGCRFRGAGAAACEHRGGAAYASNRG